MSTFRERTVTCAVCGTRTAHTLAVAINGDRQSDHRRQIIAGDFQVLTCPGCGAVAQADGPLLYLELEARRWIACFPRAWETSWRLLEREPLDNWRSAMIENAPASVRKAADRYVVRAVFGLPALREKLLCLDAGLDDRMLEVLKLDLMRRGGEVLMHPRARPLLIAVADDTLLLEAGVPPRETAAALGVESPWSTTRLTVPRADIDALRDRATEWAQAIQAVAAGPYVDLGRLMLDGAAPLPPGAALA